MFIRTWCCAFIASLFFTVSATAENVLSLYVSPDGEDRNPGTQPSPFYTLERARDEIRALKSAGRLPEQGVTVYLKGGRHWRDKVFELGAEDSGTEHAPIRYAACAGETPVVTGARRIENWRRLSESVPGLPARIQQRLYVAAVDTGWGFHSLLVNGQPQTLSRLDNGDNWRNWPKPEQVGEVGPHGQRLKFAKGTLQFLQGMDGQIEINLFPVNFWNTISVLKNMDPHHSTAWRHSKNPATFSRDGFQEGNYNLYNSVVFIDEPGEWAVDRHAGKVYLWPRDGRLQPDDEILAPVLFRLVHIHGHEAENALVHNLQFQGITFAHTDRMAEDRWPEEWIKRQSELPDAMIYVQDARQLLIQDCRFIHSGSYAVDLEGYAQEISILRNEMGYMGCGGVLLQGYGPGLKDVNRNNTVSRNFIHHTGQSGYLHSAAITLYQSGSNDISFNRIEHIPYAGVQICGANWDAYGPQGLAASLDNQDPGAVDAYGRAAAQFATRWQDFPQGRNSVFTRETFKRYLHTANNRVHHNIILEYMEKLSDGAPLYAWASGLGNQFYKNAMKRSPLTIDGQKWLFALYLDDQVDGAVMAENVVWGQVITAASSPGWRLAAGPVVYGQPYEENIFYNKGLNLWYGNEHGFPQKPAGYDALMKEIELCGRQLGGWPGERPDTY
ncbi:MAG TPA: right-handed parallel beta-helix repeat-containing protein [bacterium]|nr:right-handed parallel beta-helix repeat-containing protein [bacterium]